jgi:hypothetical protein
VEPVLIMAPPAPAVAPAPQGDVILTSAPATDDLLTEQPLGPAAAGLPETPASSDRVDAAAPAPINGLFAAAGASAEAAPAASATVAAAPEQSTTAAVSDQPAKAAPAPNQSATAAAVSDQPAKAAPASLPASAAAIAQAVHAAHAANLAQKTKSGSPGERPDGSPTEAQPSAAVEALADTPAPTRSQASERAARASSHPLVQALAAANGQMSAVVTEAAAAPAEIEATTVAAEAPALASEASSAEEVGPAAKPIAPPAADLLQAPTKSAATAAEKVKPDSARPNEAKPADGAAAAPAPSGKVSASKVEPSRSAEAAAPVQAAVEAPAADSLEAASPFEAARGEAARTEAQAQARLDAAPRGAPETVAKLAAQIMRKLEQRSTRFELALDPAGLGGVQVSLEINARGELAAHMSFDRPEAAAELRSRAQELHRALEQAGFELGQDALSFEHGGQREFAGRDGQAQNERQGAHHARAFEAALHNAELADFLPAGPHRLLSRARSGVDLTI